MKLLLLYHSNFYLLNKTNAHYSRYPDLTLYIKRWNDFMFRLPHKLLEILLTPRWESFLQLYSIMLQNSTCQKNSNDVYRRTQKIFLSLLHEYWALCRMINMTCSLWHKKMYICSGLVNFQTFLQEDNEIVIIVGM